MRFPDNLVISESTIIPSISEAIFFERIDLGFTPLVEPTFTHELAHIIIYYNLFLDIQEIEDFHLGYKKLEKIPLQSQEGIELSWKLASRFDPRYFSLFFEEVFGDLVAVHLFNNPGIMDNNEPKALEIMTSM